MPHELGVMSNAINEFEISATLLEPRLEFHSGGNSEMPKNKTWFRKNLFGWKTISTAWLLWWRYYHWGVGTWKRGTQIKKNENGGKLIH